MVRNPPAVEKSLGLSMRSTKANFTPWGIVGHLSKWRLERTSYRVWVGGR